MVAEDVIQTVSSPAEFLCGRYWDVLFLVDFGHTRHRRGTMSMTGDAFQIGIQLRQQTCIAHVTKTQHVCTGCIWTRSLEKLGLNLLASGTLDSCQDTQGEALVLGQQFQPELDDEVNCLLKSRGKLQIDPPNRLYTKLWDHDTFAQCPWEDLPVRSPLTRQVQKIKFIKICWIFIMHTSLHFFSVGRVEHGTYWKRWRSVCLFTGSVCVKYAGVAARIYVRSALCRTNTLTATTYTQSCHQQFMKPHFYYIWQVFQKLDSLPILGKY